MLLDNTYSQTNTIAAPYTYTQPISNDLAKLPNGPRPVF